jgi:CheY-like chemotaxis protein
MTKKILLADDSLTIQKVVELTFSDSDYDLVCVSNGQRALDRIPEDRPDLILADVVMPEKNGYEVCETIKGNPATAKIPVVLLSGTFEPFDRQRAERIGADAIVSKPFDSQQLLAQVEALLDRAPSQRDSVEPAPGPAASAKSAEPSPSAEAEPFDVGFSAEDFTASVRLPPVDGIDPFEEEYGRGDVDSAIEEFEKSHPQFGSDSGRDEDQPSSVSRSEESGREPLAPWLTEESEKGAPAAELGRPDSPASAGFDMDTERTVAVRLPDVPAPADEAEASDAPTQEIPLLVPEAAPTPPQLGSRPGGSTTEEISADEAAQLFEIPGEHSPSRVQEAPAMVDVAAAEAPGERGPATTAEVPREIEVLAQTASIPELNRMLSSVARNGNELSEEQLERLAARVVEKLSDRVVREIAWEVIPEMAEIVIKKRIKELESGIE